VKERNGKGKIKISSNLINYKDMNIRHISGYSVDSNDGRVRGKGWGEVKIDIEGNDSIAVAG